MSEEEKKAAEYYQDKEVSFSVDFDTEELLKALEITKEDSYEKHQIMFKTLLNLIAKLQKENKELKKSKITYEDFRDIQEKNKNIVDNNYISKQKVKDKIEKLEAQYKIALEENSTKAFILKCQITILQELQEESE